MTVVKTIDAPAFPVRCGRRRRAVAGRSFAAPVQLPGGTGLWPVDFGVSPKSRACVFSRTEINAKPAARQRRLSVFSWPAARETHAATRLRLAGERKANQI